MSHGRAPECASSTIFCLVLSGNGRPFTYTPPSWLTPLCPADDTPKSAPPPIAALCISSSVTKESYNLVTEESTSTYWTLILVGHWVFFARHVFDYTKSIREIVSSIPTIILNHFSPFNPYPIRKRSFLKLICWIRKIVQ